MSLPSSSSLLFYDHLYHFYIYVPVLSRLNGSSSSWTNRHTIVYGVFVPESFVVRRLVRRRHRRFHFPF
jgi:hypothetical protein